MIDVKPASPNRDKVEPMKTPPRQQWPAVTMRLWLLLGFVCTAAAAETAFMEYCGKCHARAASVARSVKGNTVQDRRKILDKFLSSHHAKDITLRAEIVDYLIGLVPR